MEKAKVILDRFLRPPMWVVCTVPTASFATLIFVFASHQEESTVAYPILLLLAYSFIILLAALSVLAGRLTQLKVSLCGRSRLIRKVSSMAFGKQYLNDQLFRSSVSIYQGATVNFLYILFRFMTDVKVLNFVSAMMSVLGLQTAMIACFSSNGETYRKMLNTITSGTVFFIVMVTVAVMMIQSSKIKKEVESNEEIRK